MKNISISKKIVIVGIMFLTAAITLATIIAGVRNTTTETAATTTTEKTIVVADIKKETTTETEKKVVETPVSTKKTASVAVQQEKETPAAKEANTTASKKVVSTTKKVVTPIETTKEADTQKVTAETTTTNINVYNGIDITVYTVDVNNIPVDNIVEITRLSGEKVASKTTVGGKATFFLDEGKYVVKTEQGDAILVQNSCSVIITAA